MVTGEAWFGNPNTKGISFSIPLNWLLFIKVDVWNRSKVPVQNVTQFFLCLIKAGINILPTPFISSSLAAMGAALLMKEGVTHCNIPLRNNIRGEESLLTP